MKYIAVCNGKGGCGKSTISTALAAECLRRGLRTLVVDCDAPQYTALRWAKLGEKPAIAVADPAEIPELGANYDRVIIDTAGRDDGPMRSALALADLVVIPVQPTPADLWAAAGTIEVVRQAKGLRPGLEAVVLLSRVDRRTTYSRTVRAALDKAGLPILNTEINQRNDYAASMQAGQGPTEYAPDGKAAVEIRSLFEELHNDEQNAASA